MYTEMYCGKINSFLTSIRRLCFGAFVYLFVFAISPTVTGDYISMQSISRCDTENSTFRIWLVTLARYLCECQIPMYKYKEDVRVFNINTGLEARVKNSF